MDIKKVLITGSLGLIGSESVRYFSNLKCKTIGIDNNSRKTWFGNKGDVSNTIKQLEKLDNYQHVDLDIMEENNVKELLKKEQPDLIIHTAAQPSHEKSLEIPLEDFKVNTLGTMNLLESIRLHCPNTIFIFVSTNKVYGCLHKQFVLPEIQETDFRFKMVDCMGMEGRVTLYADSKGIDETYSIDQSCHTPFGVSKTAADLMVQEYSFCYGIKAACFRCGCITGRNHQGVEQHGFLSYLFKCAKENKEYTIYGHDGKQVRDNLHAYDLARAFHEFAKNPKQNIVYNIGGGKNNSCSILEVIKWLKNEAGIKLITKKGSKRQGDHVVYYTNNNRFKKDYPKWNITKDLDNIFRELLG